MMELIEYADSDMLMLSLASALSRDLRAALARRERAVFCVPGGTTPGPVFDMLAAVELDWARVDVILSDERWVDEGNARSNAALVRARLLQNRAAAARLHPYWRPTPRPEDSIDALNAEIGALLPIDVALLGMGADGHVASLFPDAPELEAALRDDAPPLMVMHPESQPEARLTLTRPALRGAFELHIVITGDQKRAVLDRAEDAEARDLPVAAVLGSATVHWAE